MTNDKIAYMRDVFQLLGDPLMVELCNDALQARADAATLEEYAPMDLDLELEARLVQYRQPV